MTAPETHPANPFKGLRPYNPKEKLFGRDRDLILMKDRIFSCRTTLLFAGSGVGKTSFLNAKVVPELKSQFSVILHNRWTGVDETEEDDSNGRPPLRLWPVPGFFRALKETWHSWRSRRHAPAKPPLQPEVLDEGQIVDDVRRAITQSLQKDGNGPRLSSVLAPFKTTNGRSSSPPGDSGRCLLILDQFEEVFQYHAYQDYFADFIADLCQIVNDDNYHVRIILSMREEFLGELSVFDNRIPDLFNNYYRLRSPEKEEAKDIIELTCRQENVNVDKDKLDLFVDDLSKLEQGFEDQQSKGPARARLVRRNFVPPPYLQIACERLWNEQFKTAVGSNGELLPNRASFLVNYSTASEDRIASPDSDALRAVRTFCESKLNRPFLTAPEQELVARAFNFLVTRQGAKMAYELNSLASHMDVSVLPLQTALQKLSRPDARILRESRGTQRSYWYELYHDMYATIIERWKRSYYQETRRHDRIRRLMQASILAAVIAVSYVGYRLVYKPLVFTSALDSYSASMASPEYDLKYNKAYYDAYSNFTALGEIWGYGSAARSRWAAILDKRARLHMQREERDQALISLLQAAALSANYDQSYLALANNLFSKNEEAIEETYCSDCTAAALSPDGQSAAAITRDKELYLFHRSDRPWSSYSGENVDQAVFSADGKLLVYLSGIRQIPSRQDGTPQFSEKTPRTSDLPRLAASPAEAAALDEVSKRTDSSTSSAPKTKAPTVDSWEFSFVEIRRDDRSVRVSTFPAAFRVTRPVVARQRTVAPTAESPEIRLLGVSKTPMGYLVAGIVGSSNANLTVWDENGNVVVDGGVVRAWRDWGGDSDYMATFSNGGKYLGLASGEQPLRVWAITEQQRKLTRINGLVAGNLLSFSPGEKYLVGANKAGLIEVWDCAREEKLFTLPQGKDPAPVRIGFGQSDNRFFIEQDDHTIKIWDIPTRKPLASRIPPESFAAGLFTDADLKNTVRWLIRRELANNVFEKWSLESGQKVGELKVFEAVDSAYMDPKGETMLLLTGSAVRSWRIPAATEKAGPQLSDNELSRTTLSPDGSLIRTLRSASINQPFELRFWSAEDFTPLYSFHLPSPSYSVTYDGSRLALVSDGGIEIYDRGRPSAKLVFAEKINGTQFNHDGRLLLVNAETEIQLIDTATYASIGSLKSEVSTRSMMVNPSRNFLVIQQPSNSPFEEQSPVGNVTFEVWSLSSQQKLRLPSELSGFQGQFELSDNDQLLIADKGKVQIWDLPREAKIAEFSYDPSAQLVFSHNGEFVVTGDPNGRLELRSVASPHVISHIKLGRGAKELLFTRDNTHLHVVTDSWVHYLAVDRKGFHYVNGVMSGSIKPASLRQLDAAGERIRWVGWSRQDFAVRTISFSGSRNLDQQNPEEMLHAWEKRLGLSMDQGTITRGVPPRVEGPTIVVPYNAER